MTSARGRWYCDPCRVRHRKARNNRPKQSATKRGYGREHQRARREFLAAFQPGDPCARCAEPMIDPPELLDLDHTDDRTGYLGLSHRACNRATSHKAREIIARICDGCGVPFQTRQSSQFFCMSACRRQAQERRAA